jgi:hypothetical protein
MGELRAVFVAGVDVGEADLGQVHLGAIGSGVQHELSCAGGFPRVFPDHRQCRSPDVGSENSPGGVDEPAAVR